MKPSSDLTPSDGRGAALARGALGLGAILFGLLATLNAAGYRYGVADQAFYVPAVLRQIDPALFPRDAALIVGQSRLFVLDELFAILHRATGVPIAWLFFAGYVATIAALYAALVALGRTLYARWWTVAALALASTLRHRITKTGANTLEGHFHPRMLAFAIGLFALIAVLRQRPAIAVLLVIAAGVVHPTTAMFFAVWVGVALFVNEPRTRRPLAIAAGAAAVAAAVVLGATGALSLAPMDAEWVAAFVDKDYIFPTDWSIGSWLMNFLYPVVIAGVYALRVRRGAAHPREAGIVAGCLMLVALFLISLPFIAARSALIVQLQTSRVFWMADFLAVVYVLWLVAEGAGAAAPAARWRAPALAIVLATVAAARGWYVMVVEHSGRPLLSVDLPDDEWRDMSYWLRDHTPKDAHVLVDPGHAYRYGTSLRVSAQRDVFLEGVKDVSIGLYARDTALRVTDRLRASADLDWANPNGPAVDRVKGVASRYDLQYLVTEGALPSTAPFPVVYRNARFSVYRLEP